MLVQRINFKFLFFFNHYDLLQKYCYNNFYVIPVFNNLSLKIFLKGFFNKKLFRKYTNNILLILLFCFNFPETNIKLSKLKNRKRRIYKVKLFINYNIMKKKILLSIYNFFFILNKFTKPFFFSKHSFIFSKYSGKLFFNNIKIITTIPFISLIDSFELRYFKLLKNSKIFLTFSLKNILTIKMYNFFLNNNIFDRNYLKNFLFIWHLI